MNGNQDEPGITRRPQERPAEPGLPLAGDRNVYDASFAHRFGSLVRRRPIFSAFCVLFAVTAIGGFVFLLSSAKPPPKTDQSRRSPEQPPFNPRPPEIQEALLRATTARKPLKHWIAEVNRRQAKEKEAARPIDLGALTVEAARKLARQKVRVSFTVDSLRDFPGDGSVVVQALGPEHESRTIWYVPDADPGDLVIGKQLTADGIVEVIKHEARVHEGVMFPGFEEIRIRNAKPVEIED